MERRKRLERKTHLKSVSDKKKSERPFATTTIAPTVSDFEREFLRAKPSVRRRSRGRCEAAAFIELRLVAAERFPTADGGHQVANAHLEWKTRAQCTGIGQTVHHRRFRSRGGSNSLTNLIHLCWHCHAWTHSYGRFSRTLGLSLRHDESESWEPSI